MSPFFASSKRDDHHRLAFGRSGTHLVDLADGVDRVFDLLGDFGFHFFGRCAGIGNADGDRWDIDFRKQIDAKREI